MKKLLPLALLLSACATQKFSISPELCGRVDWENVGLIDGREGMSQEYKLKHRQACLGRSEVDVAAYDRGWEKGVKEYCTPENVFNLGAAGETINPVCPADKMPALNVMLEKGYALRRTRIELQATEKAIDAEKERRAKDQSVLNHLSQAYHMLAGTSPTQELDNKAVRLRDEVNRIEVGSPARLRTPAVEAAERDGNLTLGALAGTVVGFGVGHAIQGRWRTSGWKWTAGEVGTFGSLLAVQHNECTQEERPSGDLNGPTTRCRSSWPTVSVLVWLGFRVWQSLDLFGYDGSDRYAVGISPEGLQFVYNF